MALVLTPPILLFQVEPLVEVFRKLSESALLKPLTVSAKTALAHDAVDDTFSMSFIGNVKDQLQTVRTSRLKLLDPFLDVLGPPYFDVSSHVHLEDVEVLAVHGGMIPPTHRYLAAASPSQPQDPVRPDAE